MRHAKPYRKLSRQRSHYRALMRNLTLSVLEHERIETTLVKAKEVRGFIDQIITLGKSGTLHDRRRAFALMGNKTITEAGKKVDLIGKAFKELATRYAKRNGGYTRIVPTGCRPGDAAQMAILELIGAQAKLVKTTPEEPAKKATKAKTSKKAAKEPAEATAKAS